MALIATLLLAFSSFANLDQCRLLVELAQTLPGAEYQPGVGGYFYIHRKSVADANTTVSEIIARAIRAELHVYQSERVPSSVLVLDFSLLNFPALSSANIITPEVSARIGARDYADLSESERAETIFWPYLKRLESKQGASLIPLTHIDHHYDLPVLARTSTTVLVADWIEWLIKLRSHQDTQERAMRALVQIENAFRIFDHSDADILLSHWLSLRAQDERFQKRAAPIARAVALYNDHAKRPEGSLNFQQEVRFLYDIALSVEQSVRDGALRIDDAFHIFDDAIREADVVSLGLEQGAFLEAVKDRAGSPSLVGASRALPLWLAWQEKWNKRTSVYKTAMSLGFSEFLGDEVSHFRKKGKVLIAWFRDEDVDQDSGSLLQYLLDEHPGVLSDVDYILLSSQDSRSGLRTLKVRVADPTLDLNPLYRTLREYGLDAGGRAAAGSAAFGKSGAQPSDSQAVWRALYFTARILNGSKDAPEWELR